MTHPEKNKMNEYDETIIEEKICHFCRKRFLLLLRMSDIADIKGWILATKAKEEFKKEIKNHVCDLA